MKIEIITVKNERIVCQKFHRDFLVFFQRIALWHDDAHLIFRKEERFKILIRDGADDAYINDAFLNGWFNDFGTMFIQFDGNLRICFLEFTQKLCEYMGIRNRRKSDLNRILLQIEFVFKVWFQMFKNKQAALSIVQEDGSRSCDFYSLRISDKERNPQLFFKWFDHTADCRLWNVQISGRLAEALLLRHFHKILQVTIVHGIFLLFPYMLFFIIGKQLNACARGQFFLWNNWVYLIIIMYLPLLDAPWKSAMFCITLAE